MFWGSQPRDGLDQKVGEGNSLKKKVSDLEDDVTIPKTVRREKEWRGVHVLGGKRGYSVRGNSGGTEGGGVGTNALSRNVGHASCGGTNQPGESLVRVTNSPRDHQRKETLGGSYGKEIGR